MALVVRPSFRPPIRTPLINSVVPVHRVARSTVVARRPPGATLRLVATDGLMKKALLSGHRGRTNAGSILQGTALIAGFGTTLGCAAPASEPEAIELLLELARAHRALLEGLKDALNYREADLFAATDENEEQIFGR